MKKKLLAIRLPLDMTDAICRFAAHSRITFSQGIAFLLYRSLTDQVDEWRAWKWRTLDNEDRATAKCLEKALAAWRELEKTRL